MSRLNARGTFVQLLLTLAAVLFSASARPASVSAQAPATEPSPPTAVPPPATTAGPAPAPTANAPPHPAAETAQAPAQPATAPTELPAQAVGSPVEPRAEGDPAAPPSAPPPAAELVPQQAEHAQAPSPGAPPSATPLASDTPISLDQYVHLQTLVRLNERRELLLAANRKWKGPAIALGIGVSTLVIGGLVFRRAWNQPVDCYSDWCESDFNSRMDVTGLVMMPVGAAIMLASAVPLIVRVVRTRRLRRVEDRLEQLGFSVPVTR